MKVRKLAVALALAGGLGSGVAQALGLGEIELQSFLNEPLDADINLRKSEGVSPGDVFVNIAPQSAFERVGIEKNYFLTKLNFQVKTAPNGSLVVNVSSREPLREPYLNFLVEVTWPNGRLMREYSVLVDPPVYSEESGVTEQVSAPASSQASRPQQARPSAPAQTGPRTTTSTRQAGSTGVRTLGPTNSADTLWTIAAQTRPGNDVSMQQMMLAIQDLNPDAFIDGNINRLKRGEILRIPDENQIRSRSRAQANQEVAAQNRAFSSPQPTVDATGDTAGTPAGEPAGTSSGGDQLRLMAADDTAARDTDDGGSAGGDGDTAGGADAGSVVAMEQLESARRENEELTGRVDDLQDQVQTLQRLLELKNSQLAEMQNSEGQAADDLEMAEGESAPAEDAAESSEPADAEVASDGQPTDGTTTVGGADSEAGMAADEAEDAGVQESSDEAGAATAPSATEETAEEPSVAEPAPEPALVQKPFPGNIIDAITNNPLYQFALGGGLIVLLLLLLLLARRNANREKAFYDQLNSEPEGDESESFDLTFDEGETAEAPEGDAIAEADAYIAYGRNDQAAYTLEDAISREPSRSDLRLKLLAVYADIQDRESFDKQFREIEALDDETATAEAKSLQDRLEEDESMPSIDDLESQLRSGGSDSPGFDIEESQSSSYDSDYNLAAWEDPETNDVDERPDEGVKPELDFEDLDLDLPDADDEQPKADDPEVRDSGKEARDDSDGMIEFDLSDLDTEEDSVSDLEDSDKSEKSEDLDEPFDFSLEEGDLPEDDKSDVDEDDDLSLDFDTSDLDVDDKPDSGADMEKTDARSETDEARSLDVDDDGDLDESFLDDLDAELDKVASEDEASGKDDESELDDLELDVSDEDLALMEEFSESDDQGAADAPESAEDEELSLDAELGLEDNLKGEEPADPEQELEGAEHADELRSKGGASEGPDEDESIAPPIASKPAPADDSDTDIDEADLGDDDDFDFLTGTDEAATKLDLARAYVEMGDVDGARDILEEVALEGDEEQKAEAQDLLKNLS